MQVPQHFDVSLTPSPTTTVSVMQGDGLRLLVAHLKKDTEPWPVPEGICAGLSYERSDQMPGYYDRMSDGTPACVINGDQVSLQLDPMLTERPEPVKASIILRDPDGIQVATFPFLILVEQMPGLVHAENMRMPVHRFDGKIYYGGVAGIPQPLGLGNGLQAETQKDGSLLLVADGNTPVRGVDYWTPADQEAIVQQVIAALGTPVFGRVDADHNIVLTGELADGAYTVKYEDVDGTVTEIGELVQGPTYTNQLPISTETDGSVYNGTGYKINTRGNSSGEPADFDPKISGFVPFLTGFIPVKQGDVIRLKNCYLEVSNTESRNEAYTNVGGSGYWGIRSGVYDSGKNKLQVVSWGQLINMEQNVFSDYDKTNGEITEFTIAYSGVSFVRLTLATNGSPADAIITVNEEIV